MNKQFFFSSLLFYSFMLVFLPIILLNTPIIPQLFSKKRVISQRRSQFVILSSMIEVDI